MTQADHESSSIDSEHDSEIQRFLERVHSNTHDQPEQSMNFQPEPEQTTHDQQEQSMNFQPERDQPEQTTNVQAEQTLNLNIQPEQQEQIMNVVLTRNDRPEQTSNTSWLFIFF